ncbi:MAG: pectinacetylesterase family protein [Anaerolineae bacterium]|nr:pectinacetylesterase family protein [Anaerolineae bacterium]
MRKFLGFVVCVVAVGLMAVAVGAQEAPTAPTFDELPAGEWVSVPGGEGTICSTSTPYNYYVRRASEPTDKVFVHFQGGGACWFGEICDLSSSPSFDPLVDDSDNPAEYPVGLYDFNNPDNPFSDYNHVFVPYCTGDVHIGNNVTTYPVGETPRNVKIYHNGYGNVSAVLDWMFANIENPSEVFVTGCSAGAIPSPFYTMSIAEQYPDARIAQWGDSAGGYRNIDGSSARTLTPWNTVSILPEELASMPIEEIDFELLYSAAAEAYPNVQFSQFNHSGDDTQYGFLGLTGIQDQLLLDLLLANYDDIKAGLPADNFHTYTLEGNDHCITFSPAIYEVEVDGVKLIDWLRALANGEAVEDVTCTDCALLPSSVQEEMAQEESEE